MRLGLHRHVPVPTEPGVHGPVRVDPRTKSLTKRLRTGDVAVIHPDGTLQLTDRTKDVIKSGGEWISSAELENAAVGHPAVAEAAAIGVPHPKWDERPILVVVKKPGMDITAADLLQFLSGKVAKWWLPDAVEFVDEIPHTGTGKISKKDLRDRFRDYRLAS